MFVHRPGLHGLRLQDAKNRRNRFNLCFDMSSQKGRPRNGQPRDMAADLLQATEARNSGNIAPEQAMNAGNQIWMNRDQASAHFGIAPRTLTHWYSQGKVERRQVGRRALYRLTTEATAATDSGHRSKQAQPTGARGNASPVASLALVPSPEPQLADSRLSLALIQQLSQELQTQTAKHAEATTIGFMLADERDALRAKVGQLETALRGVVASPRSLGIRSALLALLGQQ